jgi:O-antigen/teichoic acid export membrane protein
MNEHPKKDGHYGSGNFRRSLSYFVLGKSVGGIIGVCWLLLLIRSLPASDYGIYVGLVAYLEIFNLLSNLGLSPISERFVPEYRSRNDEPRLRGLIFKLVVLRVVLVCILASIMAALASSLVPLFGFAIAPQTFVIFHVVVATESIARFVETIFDSLLLQGRSQISLFSRTGTRLILVFAALSFHPSDTFDLGGLVRLEALSYLCGLTITLYFLWRTQNELGTARHASMALLPLLTFAAPIYGAEVVGCLISIEGVKLLVLKTAGAEASAIFGFCAALAWYLMRYLPSFLLIGMIRPLIVAAVTDPAGGSRLQRIVSMVIKLNVVLIGCALAISLSVGDQLVAILSGGKFVAGGGYLSMLLLVTLSQSVRNPYNYIALACGQGRAMLLGQLTGLFILALGTLASSAFGLYAYCTALVAIDLAAFRWVQRALLICRQAPVLPWDSFVKTAFFVSTGWVAGFLVSNLFSATWQGWPQLVAASVAVSLVFMIFTISTRLFTSEEIKNISRLLPNFKKYPEKNI